MHLAWVSVWGKGFENIIQHCTSLQAYLSSSSPQGQLLKTSSKTKLNKFLSLSISTSQISHSWETTMTCQERDIVCRVSQFSSSLQRKNIKKTHLTYFSVRPSLIIRVRCDLWYFTCTPQSSWFSSCRVGRDKTLYCFSRHYKSSWSFWHEA